MARLVVPLTDSKCAAARPREKPYKLSDGQGLFLFVKVNGTKTWRFKYTRPDGREALATLGNYPALGLMDARERRGSALALLARNIDPIENERQVKIEQIAARLSTFEALAREWHTSCARKWSAGHAKTVLSRLDSYLFPAFGKRPIAELEARDLLAPLKVVESRGSLELASRLRNYESAIMRYAVQNGHIKSDPARDLAGATAANKSKHRPALSLDRLPELLQRIDADTGRPLTILAVKLALLVFIRSSELRFSRWAEININQAMWEIPAERKPIEGVKNSHRGSKMNTPHLVPLSRQSLAVMQQIQPLTGHLDLVFAGDHYHWRPMSENTVNKALRRMGYDTKTDLCGHGFRTMACSSLIESGMWSRDAVERQMSHQERNGVRAAYIHKAEHIEERRLMIQWWADYLDANRVEHITPYDFAKRGVGVSNVVEFRKA